MTYIDLCAGIGGFAVALNNLGFSSVGFSEISKKASKFYTTYFNDDRNYGDLTKLDPSSLPDFDILCSGFPCQPFSIMGLRNGFEHKSGSIFDCLCNIIKVKRPKFCILENVRGLLQHDAGRTFKYVLLQMAQLRYDVEWYCVDLRDFGIPQSRPRVLIVANHRMQHGIRPVFVTNSPGVGIKEKKADTPATLCLTKTYQTGTFVIEHTDTGPKETEGWEFKARTDVQREFDIDDVRIRRLSCKEALQLQGLPLDFDDVRKELGISSKVFLGMIGNAVPPPMIDYTARGMIRSFNLNPRG